MVLRFFRIDESKQVISPSFGGANGMYFEEWTERIKNETLAAVREIGAHKNIALDVSSTIWHHQMNMYLNSNQYINVFLIDALLHSFNEKIAAVERKVEALVRMVMDDVCNIYEGLNGLQQLLHYFQRASFGPLLKEQSNMVIQLVAQLLTACKNCFGTAVWDAAERC